MEELTKELNRTTELLAPWVTIENCDPCLLSTASFTIETHDGRREAIVENLQGHKIKKRVLKFSPLSYGKTVKRIDSYQYTINALLSSYVFSLHDYRKLINHHK
ncbi:hypothetical protein CLV42_12617 [Chitinophaga ginsengisoli]|uniref:Uncharacterized protein n=1 Tax=Chitinophaga ginsengisoli TaxID=363837 RepID=A0A2P8FDW1_9BACT|nr:hypothetical protein CLV42_12617 [Chitinophaga ginsengisoli]